MTTLISFDVDGTLITSTGDSANKLHRRAFAHAFQEVFGMDTHIDVVQHHGSTDPLILVSVLQHHGVSREDAMAKLPQLQAAMESHFDANQNDVGEGLALLPGVADLMAHLQARGGGGGQRAGGGTGVLTCLVTGNLEAIGWSKMQALGIHEFFSSPPFGGFGSDHCSGNHEESWKDRARLVEIAAQKAALALPEGERVGRHFHVGDTPADIKAAEAAGATAIGVLTGVFSRDQLQAASPAGKAVLLDDLADLQLFLEAAGLA